MADITLRTVKGTPLTNAEVDANFSNINTQLNDHNHNALYLRSVNGVTPDGSGNVAVNVDLSSRVAKSGDTMTGNLTIQNTAPTITMQDTDNVTRSLHVNSDLMGFLKSDGNWDMYMNNGGSMWTANYGWLHDYFFRSISNCEGQTGGINENCYGGGNILNGSRIELIDEGGNLRIRRIGTYSNCNCACK